MCTEFQMSNNHNPSGLTFKSQLTVTCHHVVEGFIFGVKYVALNFPGRYFICVVEFSLYCHLSFFLTFCKPFISVSGNSVVPNISMDKFDVPRLMDLSAK